MVDTLHPPASVIATWPKPNYINPPSRGPGLEYVCIIFAVLGFIVVMGRVYSRLFITKAPGLDDFLVVIALGFMTALVVLVVVGNRDYYSGRHIWDIPPSSYVGSRINVWASLWCYVIGITLVKISVLLFYRRLSVKFSKVFLLATWIGIVYNILYFMSFGLTLLLLCRPLHSYWDSFNPVWVATHKFHCAAENAALPTSSALSVVGDFYSTALPLVLVYHLDLPRRQKIALYALFALGFAAVAAGLIRTVLMYNLLNVDYDFTWELWVTWICAVLELYFALFAASAPSLKPFFRRFFLDSVHSFQKGSRRLPEDGAGAKGLQGKGGTANTSTTGTGTGRFLRAPAKGQLSVDMTTDIENIGLAWGGPEDDESTHRERRFLEEAEQQEDTKHFELRASRDGTRKKMIPMQVYKRSGGDSRSNSDEAPSSDPFGDGDSSRDRQRQPSSRRTHSNSTTLTQDWPMSRLATASPQRNLNMI